MSRLKPAELPHWPRLLTRDLAAAYVGASPSLFEEEVKAGRWPKGRQRGFGEKRPRIVWDRLAIDRMLDGEDAATMGPEDDYEQRRAASAARRKTGSQARG